MFERFLDRVTGHPPSQASFADLMQHAVRKAGYTGVLTFEPDQFRFVHGEASYFFLSNAYDEYRSTDRSSRTEVVQRYARLLVQPDPDDPPLDEVRHLLVPVIRNLAAMLDLAYDNTVEGGNTDSMMQFRSFGPDCVELLAIDRPEVTATLTHGPARQWGITLDQALVTARENLRAMTTEGWTEVAPGVLRGPWSDSYEPSRALFADVLERAPVKGRPVFMIPVRDVLLVAGDRDESGLREMVELAHAAFESGGRWLSAYVYRYDDALRPVPFALESGEAQERQRDLERLLLNESHAMQKASLDKRNELQERDIFVASYSLRRKNVGSHLFSWCTWTEGVLSLLPRADLIAIVVPSDDDEKWNHMLVDWEAAMLLIGHLLEEQPGCCPPRYRTMGFPDASLRERLVAVEP